MTTTKINRFALAPIALLAALAGPGTAYAQDEEAASPRTGGVDVTPYIEASQIVYAELEPGSDVVTYSQLAAGVDASITGRNSAAAISLRYERQIGWSEDSPDGDIISGLARASVGVIPRAVTF